MYVDLVGVVLERKRNCLEFLIILFLFGSSKEASANLQNWSSLGLFGSSGKECESGSPERISSVLRRRRFSAGRDCVMPLPNVVDGCF